MIVNNAGYTHDGVIHKMSDEQWYAMIDVHLTGPFRLLRAASLYWRDWAKAETAEGTRGDAQGRSTCRRRRASPGTPAR